MNGSKRGTRPALDNQLGKLAEDRANDVYTEAQKPAEQTAFPKMVIKPSKKKILSPAIFIDKSNSFKADGALSPSLLLFEQLLSLVCRCYYKLSYQPEAWLRELENNKSGKSSKAPPAPAMLKIKKIKGNSDQGASGTKLVIKSMAKNQNDRRSQAQKQMTFEPDGNALAERYGMLDYLTSPLKVDFVWGNVTRALVGQGNRDLRVLPLSVRKAL